MKKFYKLVSTRAEDSAWLILLDGKPIRTPGGAMLRVPAERLAEEIAHEWSSQETDIVTESMPLTQLLVTAIDRVEKERDIIQKTVLGYLDTDLLCYRASEPPELVQRESSARDPWLGWFERQYGIRLETTTGLIALRHQAAAHIKAEQAVRDQDHFSFTVLQMVVALTGSLVLALAFVTGAAQEGDLLRALYVEEDYKADIYNEDFYGRAPQLEKSMRDVARDLKAGRVFLEHLELKKR